MQLCVFAYVTKARTLSFELASVRDTVVVMAVVAGLGRVVSGQGIELDQCFAFLSESRVIKCLGLPQCHFVLQVKARGKG